MESDILTLRLRAPCSMLRLRDRLTVGRDALNVLMLVRFQLPQLERKATSRTMAAVLKTVERDRQRFRMPARPCEFESHGFR